MALVGRMCKVDEKGIICISIYTQKTNNQPNVSCFFLGHETYQYSTCGSLDQLLTLILTQPRRTQSLKSSSGRSSVP